MEEEIEWYKLPVDLQIQFYNYAEKDSKRILKKIEEVNKGIEKVRNLIKEEEFKENGKEIRIAAIDGCKAINIKERLGTKVGVFTVGSIICYKGKTEEDLKAGRVSFEVLSENNARGYLNLLLTLKEREIAYNCLKKADLIIIDGSFYGFLYPILSIKKERGLSDKFKEALEKTVYYTNKLIESKKAIAVVKRTRTKAIGGWYYLNFKDKFLCKIPDRLILSYTLKENSFFDYRDLIGNEITQVLNNVSFLSEKEKLENLLELAKEKAFEPFNYLNIDSKHFKDLRRVQIKKNKFSNACEIEHANLSKEKLKEIFSSRNFFNEYTGLPFALDLIDEFVSFSYKFSEEYISEIEARLINKEKVPLDLIRIYFSYLNPQKVKY